MSNQRRITFSVSSSPFSLSLLCFTLGLKLTSSTSTIPSHYRHTIHLGLPFMDFVAATSFSSTSFFTRHKKRSGVWRAYWLLCFYLSDYISIGDGGTDRRDILHNGPGQVFSPFPPQGDPKIRPFGPKCLPFDGEYLEYGKSQRYIITC